MTGRELLAVLVVRQFRAVRQKGVRIVLNDEGSFIGGIKVSEKTLRDYRIERGKQIRFRIFVPENAEHKGGFTLFGKGFGDYNEGIVCNFLSK